MAPRAEVSGMSPSKDKDRWITFTRTGAAFVRVEIMVGKTPYQIDVTTDDLIAGLQEAQVLAPYTPPPPPPRLLVEAPAP